MFAIHAATGPGLMGELIDVDRARSSSVRPSEAADAASWRAAKAQLKAGLLMSLESSSARAEQMARQLLTLRPRADQRRADRQGRRGDGRQTCATFAAGSAREPCVDRRRSGRRSRKFAERAAARSRASASGRERQHGIPAVHHSVHDTAVTVRGRRRVAAPARDGRLRSPGPSCGR